MSSLPHAPRACPVCGERLALTRLSCSDCETELSGSFAPCDFCSLDEADREILMVFLRSRGNMKELERHLAVSYPTARTRFDRLLSRLGLEEGDGEPDRLSLLESLSRGEIDVDQAIERLA